MSKQVKLISEDALAHFGVLGMKWGVRRSRNLAGGVPGLGGMAAAKAVLGKNWKNKDSAKKVLDVFKPRTDPVYDKNGRDTSARPYHRLGKKKGQSDKEFDAEVESEAKAITKEIAAEKRAKAQKTAANIIRNKEVSQNLSKTSLYFRQAKWLDQKLGGNPNSSPEAVIARNIIGQLVVTGISLAVLSKIYE